MFKGSAIVLGSVIHQSQGLGTAYVDVFVCELYIYTLSSLLSSR